MDKELTLRVIGSVLTILYLVMMSTSVNKTISNIVIAVAIASFFTSGIIEAKNKRNSSK